MFLSELSITTCTFWTMMRLSSEAFRVQAVACPFAHSLTAWLECQLVRRSRRTSRVLKVAYYNVDRLLQNASSCSLLQPSPSRAVFSVGSATIVPLTRRTDTCAEARQSIVFPSFADILVLRRSVGLNKGSPCRRS